MGNPKNIHSYPIQLINMIRALSRVKEPRKVPVHLGTHNATVTFGSRFSTLKNLLADEANRDGDIEGSNRIRACRLQGIDYKLDDKGRNRPTGWNICNSEGSMDASVLNALQAALEEQPDLGQVIPQEQLDKLQKELEREQNSAIGRFYGSYDTPPPAISTPDPQETFDPFNEKGKPEDDPALRGNLYD